MDAQTAKQRFVSLPEGKKKLVLASLGHQLTIYARGSYLEDRDLQSRFLRLRAFNEIQHQVTGHLHGKLIGAKVYPDDILMDILFEIAQKAGCERDLLGALGWALDRLRPAAQPS